MNRLSALAYALLWSSGCAQFLDPIVHCSEQDDGMGEAFEACSTISSFFFEGLGENSRIYTIVQGLDDGDNTTDLSPREVKVATRNGLAIEVFLYQEFTCNVLVTTKSDVNLCNSCSICANQTARVDCTNVYMGRATDCESFAASDVFFPLTSEALWDVPTVSPAPTVSPTVPPAPTASPAPSSSPIPTVAPVPTVSPAPVYLFHHLSFGAMIVRRTTPPVSMPLPLPAPGGTGGPMKRKRVMGGRMQRKRVMSGKMPKNRGMGGGMQPKRQRGFRTKKGVMSMEKKRKGTKQNIFGKRAN